MTNDVLDFIKGNKNYGLPWKAQSLQEKWKDPEVSHIKIDFNIDTNDMYCECVALADRFVDHRKGDYAHDGWQGLTLHGISEDKTEDFNAYGFKTFEDANYHWTEVSKQTPHIKNFVESLPYEYLKRVRIMKLKAGGYIAPHNDGEGRLMGPLNFAINQPDDCEMVFENKGLVPFSNGVGFYLDVGRRHCVVNNSNEDRYHLIIHGRRNNDFYSRYDDKKTDK